MKVYALFSIDRDTEREYQTGIKLGLGWHNFTYFLLVSVSFSEE